MKKLIMICFIAVMSLILVGCNEEHVHEYVDEECVCGDIRDISKFMGGINVSVSSGELLDWMFYRTLTWSSFEEFHWLEIDENPEFYVAVYSNDEYLRIKKCKKYVDKENILDIYLELPLCMILEFKKAKLKPLDESKKEQILYYYKDILGFQYYGNGRVDAPNEESEYCIVLYQYNKRTTINPHTLKGGGFELVKRNNHWYVKIISTSVGKTKIDYLQEDYYDNCPEFLEIKDEIIFTDEYDVLKNERLYNYCLIELDTFIGVYEKYNKE